MAKKTCPALGSIHPDSDEAVQICLSCPYPYCVKEEGYNKQVLESQERKRKAYEMYKEGYTIKYIASTLGITVRTVERYLRAKHG